MLKLFLGAWPWIIKRKKIWFKNTSWCSMFLIFYTVTTLGYPLLYAWSIHSVKCVCIVSNILILFHPHVVFWSNFDLFTSLISDKMIPWLYPQRGFQHIKLYSFAYIFFRALLNICSLLASLVKNELSLEIETRQ